MVGQVSFARGLVRCEGRPKFSTRENPRSFWVACRRNDRGISTVFEISGGCFGRILPRKCCHLSINEDVRFPSLPVSTRRTRVHLLCLTIVFTRLQFTMVRIAVRTTCLPAERRVSTCVACSSPGAVRRKHLEGSVSSAEGVAQGGSLTPATRQRANKQRACFLHHHDQFLEFSNGKTQPDTPFTQLSVALAYNSRRTAKRFTGCSLASRSTYCTACVALTKSSALAGRQPSIAAPVESTPAAAASRFRSSCVSHNEGVKQRSEVGGGDKEGEHICHYALHESVRDRA